jgi:phage gp16-like protein
MARSASDKAASAVKRAGVKGVNKPKRTPSHPTKSHVVVAKVGDKVKTIRFGQQGVSGSAPKKNESEAAKKRRASFKARHAKNISKGKMSAAFWADKVKW